MNAQMLNTAQVSHLLSVSRWTLGRMVDAGKFPQPIRISRKTLRWSEETIQKWIAEREACANQQA